MRRLPGPELLAVLAILSGTGRQANDPSTSVTTFIINGFQRTGLARVPKSLALLRAPC